MARKWFVIGGVIVAGAAALYAGLVVYPAARFRTALHEAEQFLPAGTSFTYQAADYSLISDRATLRGVALRNSAPAALVTIGKITLDRPSLTLGNDWREAESNARRLPPDATIPIAAGVTLSDVAIETDTVTEKIASARLTRLRLYPWALLHPGVPGLAAALSVLKPTPPPKSLARLMPLLRLEAAIGLGVGYDGVTASTITATTRIPALAGKPARVVNTSIASVDGPANDRGAFGAGAAEHVVLQLGAPAGTFSIDRITFSSIDARRPLERILTRPRLTPATLDGLVIGRIEMAGMSIKPPARTAVALGTLALSRIAVSDGLPVSAHLSWNGLHLAAADIPDAEAQAAFGQLGLESMTISLDAAYNWELPASRLAVEGVRVKVAELGSLSLSASLVDVAPSRDVFDRARLAHAVLTYQDASLVARALKAAATATHADPGQFRREIIAMVQGRMDEFASSPALAEAAKAIATFLGAPHSLTVELSPKTPVSLAVIETGQDMAPPELASLLGLRVTANR